MKNDKVNIIEYRTGDPVPDELMELLESFKALATQGWDEQKVLSPFPHALDLTDGWSMMISYLWLAANALREVEWQNREGDDWEYDFNRKEFESYKSCIGAALLSRLVPKCSTYRSGPVSQPLTEAGEEICSGNLEGCAGRLREALQALGVDTRDLRLVAPIGGGVRASVEEQLAKLGGYHMFWQVTFISDGLDRAANRLEANRFRECGKHMQIHQPKSFYKQISGGV